MPHKLPTSRHKGLLPVRPIRMRSATRGVVSHVRRGPLSHVVHMVHILLPDTILYLYLFCIAFMRLRICYVTAYSKSAVMTAVAARSSFLHSFVVRSFVFASFSIIHLTPAS